MTHFDTKLKVLSRLHQKLHDLPSIYTTNLIENYNKHLKRYTKRKDQFPNETSLNRFLSNQVDQFNHRFITGVHKGFHLFTAELLEMFE